jgi:hypothetical protein
VPRGLYDRTSPSAHIHLAASLQDLSAQPRGGRHAPVNSVVPARGSLGLSGSAPA